MKWRSLQESGTYSGLRSLREIFADRKESIAKYVPADVQAVHARLVDTLRPVCGRVQPSRASVSNANISLRLRRFNSMISSSLADIKRLSGFVSQNKAL
jgi:hypothetical protein